jgi:hypothetical protein
MGLDMADPCDEKKEEFEGEIKVGKYSSDPFENGDRWERGNAIEAFIKKLLPKTKKICEEECSEGNAECLAKNLSIKFHPKSAGKFKKSKIDDDGDVRVYYVKVKDNCTIKIAAQCNCVPFPD